MTAGPAGVILTSVSLRLTCPPAREAGAAALLVVFAAGALLGGAREVLEDEPQPAISTATANGARSEIRSMDSSLGRCPAPIDAFRPRSFPAPARWAAIPADSGAAPSRLRSRPQPTPEPPPADSAAASGAAPASLNRMRHPRPAIGI